jgi:glycosyltransferase involved in cell wall biosynthesis
MSRRTILYVANTSWYLYNFRLNILKAMRRGGWRVIVTAPRDTYTERLEKMGFRYRELNIDRKGYSLFRDTGLLLGLHRLLGDVRPSIVHFFTIKPVLYGTLVARWFHIPLIVSAVPGLGYIFLQRSGLQTFIQGLYKLAFQDPSVRVIFQNPDDRDYFVRKHLVHKGQTTLILGSGVDMQRFRPVTLEVKDREPGNTVRFGLISRMLWDKGIGEFVEVARRLGARYPQTRYELVGDSDAGNPNAIPQSWLEKNLNTPYLRWHGHVENVPELLKSLDVVVLPSRYREGVPRSLVEAAAMGKPLITTDTPGCREIVRHGENGLLIPPGSVDALEQAMEQLLLDYDLRRRMGQASRSLAVRYFSDETVVKQTLKVYGLTP